MGDRRTELVLIGQAMDHAAITTALEQCVMTDEEMNAYTKHFRDAKVLSMTSPVILILLVCRCIL